MNTRIKPQTLTRARAEELLGEVATLTLERNAQKIEMDRALTTIRERYEVSLAALSRQLEEKSTLLEMWAGDNRAEFPKGRKSIDLVHGTVGYRTGTPKLKTLARKTWEAILATIKGVGLNGYVRVKEEVDKEAILADFAQGLMTEETLKPLGVKVAQDETFFVEPKLERLTTREALAA